MNEQELKKEIESLVVELINNQNSTFELKKRGKWIGINYIGKGSESIELWVDEVFHENFRVRYAKETIKRLEQIKKDLLEE